MPMRGMMAFFCGCGSPKGDEARNVGDRVFGLQAFGVGNSHDIHSERRCSRSGSA